MWFFKLELLCKLSNYAVFFSENREVKCTGNDRALQEKKQRKQKGAEGQGFVPKGQGTDSAINI